MVKGRKIRSPVKGSVRTHSTSLKREEGTSKACKRKENKIDFSGKLAHSPCGVRTYGSSMCIDSFFYSDSPKPCKAEDEDEEKYETSDDRAPSERSQNVDGKKITTAEFFKTDETPVAVPLRSPPTPHRINMPVVHREELCIRIRNDDEGKKSSYIAFGTVQAVGRKQVARNRGKLHPNQSSNRQAAGPAAVKSENHKVTEYYPVRRSVRKCKKVVLEEKQRDLENKVLCQVEEGLEVRNFAGKGRGVVSKRKFFKGEFVVEYIGELIDQVTAKKREAEYARDQNTGCYMYYFQHRSHQYCVDATPETEKLGRLVNHSRNGNLIARVVEVGSVPHLVLTAKEDIPAGVEVTYDYGDRSREAIRNHPWLAL